MSKHRTRARDGRGDRATGRGRVPDTRLTRSPDVPVAGTAASTRSSSLAGVAASLALLGVYLLSLSRGVATGDSGELVAAAYTHGVAHPPGYPLFTILGFLVTRIPIGSPALLVNLMSAVMSAAAIGFVFVTAARLARFIAREDLGPMPSFAPLIAGAAATIALGTSSAFWANAIVAEVFAMNSLLAAVLLFVAFEWYRDPSRHRYLYAGALAFGLALANQQTIVLLVPALAVLGLAGWMRSREGSATARSRSPWWRAAAICGALLAIGLLPYLYLPIAASTDPPMDWGDPRDVGGLIAVITRSTYGSLSLVSGDRHGSVVEQLSLFGSYLVTAFTPVGAVLAVAGAVVALRRMRAVGLVLITAFLVAGPLFLGFANVPIDSPLTKGILERFYILPSIPFALLIALGAAWVYGWAAEQLEGRATWARAAVAAVVVLIVIGTPVLAAGLRFPATDRSHDRVAEDYGADILAELEPDALLLMRSDENYTSLAYAQHVAGLRPDVIGLDVELLKLPSYVAQQKRNHPDLAIPWEAYDGGTRTKLADVVGANIGRRPVYYVGEMADGSIAERFDDVRAGLVHRLSPRAAGDEYRLLRTNPFLVGRLHFPDRTYDVTTWEHAISETYAQAAFDQAFALQTATGTSDPASVAAYYRMAIRLRPDEPLAYKNLGLYLLGNGGDRTEVARLWSVFLRLAPSDKDAPAIRSKLATLPTP